MANLKDLPVLIRGAGEMASGVAHRLWRAHFKILFTERPAPLAVRRTVSFCEAVHEGQTEVEGLVARRVENLSEAEQVWAAGGLPVLVDPDMTCLSLFKPAVLIEATLAKANTWGLTAGLAPLVVALGPGFSAPQEAHFVVETNRGHNLGRIIELGQAEANTGQPGRIEGYTWQRVFRAPRDGVFDTQRAIGDLVEEGEVVGRVADEAIKAQVAGMIRGLIRPGTPVTSGLKIGDVDPRGSRALPNLISEKARAIGGSVLECILRVHNT